VHFLALLNTVTYLADYGNYSTSSVMAHRPHWTDR